MRPRKEEASKEAYELLRKAKSISERIDTLEKASPDFKTTFSTEPHNVSFESESGGRTRNAYYTTNNHLLDAKDVKNAGASKSSVDLDSMGKKLNTHDLNSGHEEFAGGDGPKLD